MDDTEVRATVRTGAVGATAVGVVSVRATALRSMLITMIMS